MLYWPQLFDGGTGRASVAVLSANANDENAKSQIVDTNLLNIVSPTKIITD